MIIFGLFGLMVLGAIICLALYVNNDEQRHIKLLISEHVENSLRESKEVKASLSMLIATVERVLVKKREVVNIASRKKKDAPWNGKKKEDGKYQDLKK